LFKINIFMLVAEQYVYVTHQNLILRNFPVFL
jgi:hypothetical protein